MMSLTAVDLIGSILMALADISSSEHEDPSLLAGLVGSLALSIECLGAACIAIPLYRTPAKID